MLEFQSGSWSEVHSLTLTQSFFRTSELPFGLYWAWPYVASQSTIGEAKLLDVVGDLSTCATNAFIWVRDFQFVEVGWELTRVLFSVYRLDMRCSVLQVHAVLIWFRLSEAWVCVKQRRFFVVVVVLWMCGQRWIWLIIMSFMFLKLLIYLLVNSFRHSQVPVVTHHVKYCCEYGFECDWSSFCSCV